MIFPLCIPTEASQRPGQHADEVHAALHPLHQTQRDEETQRLGGEQASTVAASVAALVAPQIPPIRVFPLSAE